MMRRDVYDAMAAFQCCRRGLGRRRLAMRVKGRWLSHLVRVRQRHCPRAHVPLVPIDVAGWKKNLYRLMAARRGRFSARWSQASLGFRFC